MHKSVGFIGLVVCCACSSEDPYKPDFSSRDADSAECAHGGTVLLVDGEEQVTVCNGEAGAAGVTGSTGAPGPKGDPGQVGERGPAGTAGATTIGGIQSTISCGAAIATTGLRFNYSAAIFADGATWSEGAILDGVADTSSSSFYAPTQNGALTAPVFIGRDAVGTANGGWWRIELGRVSLDVTITYNDSELAASPDVFLLPITSNGCVVNGVQQ